MALGLFRYIAGAGISIVGNVISAVASALGVGVAGGQAPALLYDEDGVTLATGHYLYTLAQTFYITGGAIGAAGLGYTAGDVVTLAGGGFGHGRQATFSVDTIGGGGAVTGLTLIDGGSYSNLPGVNPDTVTGGTGNGLTITFTSVSGFSAAHDYHLPLTSDFGAGLLLINDPLKMINSNPSAAVVDFIATAPDVLSNTGSLFGIGFAGGGILLESDGAGHWNTVGIYPLPFNTIPDFAGQNLFTIGAGAGPSQVVAGQQVTGIGGNAPFNMPTIRSDTGFLGGTSVGGEVTVVVAVNTTGNWVLVVSNPTGAQDLVCIGVPGVAGGAALPTADPHVRNALYSLLGVVHVSAG